MSRFALQLPSGLRRSLAFAVALGLAACGDDEASSGSGGGGGGAGDAAPSSSSDVTSTSSASTSSSTGTGDGGGSGGEGGRGVGGAGGGNAACEGVVCPDDRICALDGACIVDLDPGDPAGSAVADFDAIWAFFDAHYGAFPAKDVDWDEVRETYRPQVEAAATQFEAAWAITRSVAELRDGHTGAYASAICDVDPGFSFAYSTVGACVTEIDGELVVYEVAPGSDFAPGDALVSLDGRTVDEALHDRARQPRCAISASTPAQERANLVAGLMFQPSAAGTYVVERDGDTVTVEVSGGAGLECDGRASAADEIVRGPEVTTSVTADDVLIVRIARFGTYEGDAFVDGPVLDALREAFEEAGDHAGVVLDLRGNPGGYVTIYMALASWLFDAPTALFRCRNHIGPGHDDHGAPFTQTSDPDASLQYDGPLAVVVDARSFSSADFTPMWVQSTGRGVLVGAPSGGGFGNGSTGDAGVPDYFIGVNDILCEDLDGNLLEGNPPAVDVAVAFDRDDVQAGVDTVLEAAAAAVLPD